MTSSAYQPSFVGIGVQKCATSWLHEVLHTHPEIYMSDPKEIEFFSAFYDRGYEWYGRHFSDSAGAKARGETSPSYFYHPAVPQRIRAYREDMKIIVIFRDPVARAFSNHLHEVRAGHFTASEAFEDGLANNPCYLEQSRYATHYRRWVEVFPEAQLLPLIFEEIIAEPETAVRQVYEFLGVDPAAEYDRSRKSSNESVAYRNAGLQGVLQAGGHALRRAGLGSKLEAVKEIGPVKRLMELNKRDLRAEVPKPSEALKAQLAEELAGEMRELAGIMGRTSLPWPSYPA
ncbi:sulfotransferase family protein [Aestuariibius insulae]|uniref:sulfotransferase family protein n=1 Tax=Aestuariibius insulae TaxID=2058287 RepID=UPI00345E41EE